MTITEDTWEQSCIDVPAAAGIGQDGDWSIMDRGVEELVAWLLAPERIDALLAEAHNRGLAVDGPDELIQRMIGALLQPPQRARREDRDHHDRAGADRGAAVPRFVVRAENRA